MTTITTEYVKAHAAAMQLLMDLQSAVMDMPAPDSDEPIQWGHVGSLAELNSQLRNAHSFIAGTDA
jgi:hypothetical protein